MTDQELLNLARAAQAQGLLPHLPPDVQAKLIVRLGSGMKAEREAALSPPAPPPKDSNGFLAPVRAVLEDPVASAISVGRGVERATFPVNLEVMDTLANFPIIRGAELAARLFVPKDQRPDLTTYSQLLQSQIALDNDLRVRAPGIQEGTEGGIALASGVDLLRRGVPFILSKGASVINKFKTAQAVAAEKKARRLSQELLAKGDGPVLDAILNRPEKVEALLKTHSDLNVNDLAIAAKGDLETIEKELGKRVGVFRDAAYGDKTMRLPVPEDIPNMLKTIRERTTLADPTRQTGKAISLSERLSASAPGSRSLLPANIQSQLEYAERASKLGVTTPNQAMIWVDALDGVINYGAKNDVPAIKNASGMLLIARGKIKDMLRQQSGQARAWAEADDAYQGFISASDGLINKLSSDSSESLIANLFRANNTPLRNRLASALNFMEKIDPKARGAGQAFFARRADMLAAQSITDIPNEVNRVVQQRVMNIVDRWTKRGERIGSAVGGGLGTAGGFIFGGGVPGGGVAGGMGLLISRHIGSEIGHSIGTKLSNPMRVIEAAKRSKLLSKEAKDLANDLGYISKNTGPSGMIAFLDTVGPIPAVSELVRFVSSADHKEPLFVDEGRK